MNIAHFLAFGDKRELGPFFHPYDRKELQAVEFSSSLI